MKQLLTVCITVALLYSNTYSQNDNDPLINSQSSERLLIHKAGELNLAVTNFGSLGESGSDPIDSETGQLALTAEYPANSSLNYLFYGALWIGGQVVDTLAPEEYDTLVSVGDDCWWRGIHEMSSEHGLGESIWREQRSADEEIIAVYYDTLTEAPEIDPIDSREHMPLGLEITQHSLAWKTSGYNEFVIINFYIENIINRDITNAWIGLYLDNEISVTGELPGSPVGTDDLSGYFEYRDKPVVWLADNDGDPYQGEYISSSVDDVLGVMILSFADEDLQINYNWWLSNSESEYDWGPQLQTNYDIWGEFGGGGKGTPGGDNSKYQLMANGEIDYDQAYSALDWTNAGWIENSSFDIYDLADGADTKCLLSVGPFDITAGSAETLTVAFVGGQSLHRDANNYETYLEGHTTDSLYIAAYYNNLDFTRLRANLDTVITYYEQGWELIPPGPPDGFHVSEWGTNYIELSWQRHNHSMLYGYKIYRGIEPGIYDPVPLTPEGYTDTTFIDYDVSDNTTYYYVICAGNIYGDHGDYTDWISINTGQPRTPSELNITAGNGVIELSWQANSEDDFAGYIIYNRASGDDDYEVIDTVEYNIYSANSLVNGIKYFYRVQALDIYGNISFLSDSIWAVPMAFDSGIMLINANRSEWSYNPDYDSMMVFYETMLENYQHVTVYECPENLSQLSPYSTIIWCKELIIGRFYFEDTFDDNTALFADYLDAGGQLILAGARVSSLISAFYEREFYDNEFQYKYFNLKAIEYPEFYNNEFIGGFSSHEDFPDFFVDGVKAARIVFPEQNQSGRLYGIGALSPRDTSEILYRYNAVEPDTSTFYDRPIAVYHQTDTYKAVLLEFPLYYVDQSSVSELTGNLLDLFEEQVDIVDFATPIPEVVDLMQNYPNPFNFRTEIRYFLPSTMEVRLEVFDILGRSIITLVDESQSSGLHSVSWDGKNSEGTPATSGIYFYRLTTGEGVTAKRMVYLK